MIHFKNKSRFWPFSQILRNNLKHQAINIGPLKKQLSINAYHRFIPHKKLLLSNSEFGFCRTKVYVDQYNNLQVQIKQKSQKLRQLQQKIIILQKMSQMSLSDHLLKQIFSLFGKTYQSRSFKQHKSILIDLRNQLEKKIQESSLKWQTPRKQIIEERQKKIHQFITKIIVYEQKMAQFIKSRESIKQQHLVDIHEGLVLTHKLLIKNIEKQGSIQIIPIKNSSFDQTQHQLVNKQQLTNKKLKIKNVVVPGWKIKDEVIRKAKVQAQ